MTAIDYTFRYAALFGISFVVFLAFTVPVRRWGSRFVPGPRPEPRPWREREDARPSGIAVFPALLVAFLAVLYIWPALWVGRYVDLAAAALVLVLAGTATDVLRRGHLLKLACQVFAATMVYRAGYGLGAFRLPFAHDPIALGPMDAVASVAFIVLIINAANWLEALRGGVSTSTVLMAAFLVFTKVTQGAPEQMAVLFVATGCVVAFLALNAKTGKTVLGDAGAMAVGLLLAAELLDMPGDSATLLTLAFPLVILGLPTLDGLRAYRAGAGRSRGTPAHERKPLRMVRSCLAFPECAVIWLPAQILAKTLLKPATAEAHGLDGSEESKGEDASEPEDDAGQRRRGAVVRACVVCVVIAAAFGVAWMYPAARISSSLDYEQTVPDALEKGMPDLALQMARIAFEREPDQPGARYWYAKSLTAAGNAEAGLAHYGALFRMRSIPNLLYNPTWPGEEPQAIPSLFPFFYPAARFDMGEHCLNQNDLLGAVGHFELGCSARPAVGPGRWPVLYRAYAGVGAWARAFDYAGDALELDGLSNEALDVLVRVHAYREDWHLCRSAAQVLVDRDDTADGQFWLGRAGLALDECDEAAAAFELAVEAGHPDAGFFLGLAQEALGFEDEAGVSFAATLPGSYYLPFSLAKALELARHNADTHGIDALGSRFEASLSLGTTVAVDARGENLHRYPRSVQFEQADVAKGGPFPLLIWWPNGTPQGPSEGGAVDCSKSNSVILRRGQDTLELRWVDGLVSFPAFNLPAPGNRHPGWTELVGEQRSGGWVKSRVVPPLEVRTTAPDDSVHCKSVPAQADAADSYLFIVRCISDQARLTAGWKWYKELDEEVHASNVFNQRVVESWRTTAMYEAAPSDAAYVQACLGIYKDVGSAQFAFADIIPLDPPALR